MNFTIKKENLLECTNHLNRFTQRGSLAVLSHILFENENNEVVATATNLAESLSVNLGVSSSQSKPILVPSVELNKIIKNTEKGEEITISDDIENGVKISTTKAEYNLYSLDSDEFPRVPKYNEEEPTIYFSLPKAELLTMLKEVEFAMEKKEIKYFLHGCYLIVNKNHVRLVSTDACRIATSQTILQESSEKDYSFIIGYDTVKELIKTFNKSNKSNDIIEITATENSSVQLFFTDKQYTIGSRAIDGTFPKWDKIVKFDQIHTFEYATLNTKDLLKKVKGIQILNDPKKDPVRPIKLTFDIKSDTIKNLVIESKHPTKGIVSSTINFSGNLTECIFGVDPKFFEESINQISDPFITLLRETSNPLEPLIFVPSLNENISPLSFEDYRYCNILMPARIDN